MITLQQWVYVYVVIGFIASVSFGRYGPEIFGVNVKDMSKPQRFSQYWLNFVGSIFGWAALAVVIERLREVANFGAWDLVSTLVAFLIAFWGITGNLPLMLLQVLPWMLPPWLRELLKK